MKRVVISQPFFFPWVGMFEQIRLADVYVHYDDVQFSKGHFANRVQYKTAAGSAWLTVPLKDLHLGQFIKAVQFDDRKDWRARHLSQLAQAYDRAPFRDEMLALVRDVYSKPARGVCDVSVESIHAVCRYFGFADPDNFLFSSQMGVPGSSTARVLEVVEKVGGDVYITGHGAKNYLDHELFERRGVRVEYIDYQKVPYPQLHGEFTPYVSILDLIANCGREGEKYVCSGTRHWRDFVAETAPAMAGGVLPASGETAGE